MDNIEKLNEKYQTVKKNRHWKDNEVYTFNGDNISINEETLNISNDIIKKVYDDRVLVNDSVDYVIENINIEDIKKIIIDYYKSVDNNLENRVNYIFNNLSMEESNKRSYTSKNPPHIYIYYNNDNPKNSLCTLMTMAHEIAHAIANTNEQGLVENNNKVGIFNEVESLMTEELFLEYLKNKNIIITNRKNNEKQVIDEEIIKNIRLNRFRKSYKHAYRSIYELPYKNMLGEKIDEEIINDLCMKSNIDKDNMCKGIDWILKFYYSDEYKNEDNYDLKNGEHLSNEMRFIWADCIVQKIISMNLDNNELINKYKYYLNNVRNMTFEEVLNLFDIKDLKSISDDYIFEYNDIVSMNKTSSRV